MGAGAQGGGSTGRQVLVAVLANLPSVSFGMLYGWMSPMAPLLQSPLTPASAPLSDLAISWMASVVSLGAAAGTPLFSYASDRIGRKPSLMLISLLFALTWIIKLFSADPVPLIAARALGGLASGGIYVVIPIYVREVSQPSVLGALGSVMMFACNLGVILAYLLGVVLTYQQGLWVCLAVPLLHLALFSFMPESPAYCLKSNKLAETAAHIACLRGLGILDPVVAKEVELLQYEELAVKELPKVNVLDLVRNKTLFRSFRMALALVLTETLCGCYAVINFAAPVFYRAGTDVRPEHLALGVAALQLLGSVLSICLVERFNRKPLLATSTLLISASMFTLGSWFLAARLGVPAPAYVPVAAVCLCIFSYGAGLTSLPYIILAELFSFQLRALVIGAVICLSWVVSTFTMLLFVPLASAAGEHVVFYAFAASSLGGALYTLRCVPETRGKTLQQIQREMARGSEPSGEHHAHRLKLTLIEVKN